MTKPDQETNYPSLPLGNRIAVLGGLLFVTLLAWVYLIRMPMGAGSATARMSGMAMAASEVHPWTPADAATAFLMWAVMMVAMMLPSASPMIMTYARAARTRGTAVRFRVSVFVLGYIIAWTGFSAAATVLQYALQRAALMSETLTLAPAIGGVILVLAGVYQLTPLKQVCLRHCRSPIGFLITEWREGPRGALVMGLKHGGFCIGCCWMLMGLLFVAGVMNLVWVALIAIFVLLEKVAPWGRAIAATAGPVLIVSGLWIAGRGWT